MNVYYLLVALAVLVVAGDAKPPTDCETHRERALKISTIMKLIPECDEKGDYKPMQCYKNSSFCVCYTKDGKPASPISSKLVDCRCHFMRHQKVTSNHENAFVPQCDDKGFFVKKQTWEFNNSCWCVDEDGKQKGDVKSDCDALQCD